jgi:hypothetical protein
MLNLLSISLNHTISQSKGNVTSDMDGEKVLMSVKNGKYYNLGKLGGVIWDLVETPISVESIIMNLTTEFEVEKKECTEQVIAFLEKLNNEELIQIER